MNARITLLAAAALLFAAPATADLPDALQPGSRPALGLGGDPFRSPLRDESGWWSVMPLGIGRVRGVTSESSVPLTGHRGERIELRQGAWRGLAAEEWRSGPRTLTASAHVLEPWSNSAWAGGGSTLRLGQSVARLDLGARLDEFAPGLTLQATAPVWRERTRAGPGATGVGARWRVGSRLAAQLAWSREAHDDEVFVHAYDNEVNAGLNLATEATSADAAAHLFPRLTAEADWQRTRYVPLTDGRDPGAFALVPSGLTDRWQTGARFQAGARTELLLRRTVGDGRGQGDARYDGQRFARASYVRGTLSAWLAGASWRGDRLRLVADVERAELEATARATGETWPFTGLLIDLLGIKRVALARAEVEEWRAHAGVERAARGGTRLRAGISAYDLRPSATVTSWQPGLLGLGVTDLRENRLPWRRLQLAALSLGYTRAWSGWTLALDVRQFVYVHALRDVVPAPTPAGPSLPESASPVRRHGHGWPGGTSIAFSILRRG